MPPVLKGYAMQNIDFTNFERIAETHLREHIHELKSEIKLLTGQKRRLEDAGKRIIRIFEVIAPAIPKRFFREGYEGREIPTNLGIAAQLEAAARRFQIHKRQRKGVSKTIEKAVNH